MKKGFLFIASCCLLTACNNPKVETSGSEKAPVADTVKELSAAGSYSTNNCVALFKQAKQMDSVVMKQTELDVALANKAIKVFTDYAFYCESDSLSPIFLIKTAQIATAINNPNQAKTVLDRCISNYPKFKNKPAAIFLLAQLYDETSQLNNEAEAKKLYDQLVYEYPKTEWAANAKAALSLLGKTDEEIIKEFNKKNKK